MALAELCTDVQSKGELLACFERVVTRDGIISMITDAALQVGDMTEQQHEALQDAHDNAPDCIALDIKATVLTDEMQMLSEDYHAVHEPAPAELKQAMGEALDLLSSCYNTMADGTAQMSGKLSGLVNHEYARLAREAEQIAISFDRR
ncbi:MAG: hypothetical protein H6867_09605 [Rhodospirillales bacterium]|nr:hypothetical protein [Rhodospirillales bacterium]